MLTSVPAWPPPREWGYAPNGGSALTDPRPRKVNPPIAPARPIELVALVGICALADFAIYEGPGGAGVAALFAAVPLVLVAAAKERVLSARFLTLGALLLMVCARLLWQSSLASIALGALLLVSFTIALRMKRTYVPELALSALGSFFGSFQQLWNFGAGLYNAAGPRRAARFPLRTVLVPLGVVSVFGLIFTAANPIVQGFLESIWNHTSIAKWYPSPLRVFFWCGSALLGAALLRPVCRVTQPEAHPTTITVSVVGLATARNVLGALNVLFFAYNVLDAIYLWANKLPAGNSHVRYAHNGAEWLTVAMLLSTVVLGVIFRGALSTDPRAKWHYRLAYAWAAQNIVLAAGTFRRLQMYVDFSGLTQLRIIGICGTLLSVLALVLFVVKLARQQSMLWLFRKQLDALGIITILFIAAPTHAMCADFNVARINAGELRPLLHFFQQTTSAEGIPAMMPLLDNPDPEIRRGAAVLITDYAEALRAEDANAARWTQWAVSRERALRSIDANEAKIRVLVKEEELAEARVKLHDIAVAASDAEEWDDPTRWRR